MRVAWVVLGLCAPAAACATLSGLDGLGVGDGAAGDATLDAPASDATSDTASDASGADASVIQPDADAGPTTCPYTLGARKCFDDCDGGCCLTAQGAQCLALGDPCFGKALDCTSPNDCNDNGAPVCCLDGTQASAGCPTVYAFQTQVVHSVACVAADSCAGANTVVLCATDSDCPSGHHCVELAVSVNPKEVFGGCL